MKVGKKFDTVIVGHGKPDRVSAVNELSKRFKLGIWGQCWDGCVLTSFPEVHGTDYIRAINSGRLYISFARTVSNRLAMKYSIFEATACRVPVLCEEFEEMNDYFAYGKEVIGYSGLDDLCAKIDYYLNNYRGAAQIAAGAYARCISEHTWHGRWQELFKFLSEQEGKNWELKKGWRYLFRRLKFHAGIV